MCENKNSVLPDIITPISNAIQQNIPNTANEADSALSTVVGFFNNVVLYPVKKANLTFKYKLEDFKDDLEKKTQHIPAENLQVPPTMIAGPILESLRYTYDEDELREMYENLLASAMDNRIVTQAHPSFVDAIKQMSTFDAQVIKKLSTCGNLRCAEIKFKIKGAGEYYIGAMPNYFVEELYDLGDPFVISASLINLQRLGIIRIHGFGLVGVEYDSIKSHPYVLKRESEYRKMNAEDFEISLTKHSIILNDYGVQFIGTCLPAK